MAAARSETWRRVLLDAEQALAVSPVGNLAAAATDEHTAVGLLNEHLALGSPVLVPAGFRWWLDYRSSSPSARAAFALAQLVVQDAGFARIKHCERCRRPFIDRTAARTAKRCADHNRKPAVPRRWL